jgi:topoisomerase-4 subunit A
MLDVDDRVKLVDVFPHKPGRKRVIASSAGYGFLLTEDEAVANRKAGKQVLNVDEGEARICREAEGDHLAVVGDNGKILMFPLAELPEMARGKGVKLQSYRDGGLRDAITFDAAVGPAWTDSAGRRREWKDWRDWLGKRAGAGRVAPKGFPASKRFRPR